MLRSTFALLACSTLALAACGSDDDASSDTLASVDAETSTVDSSSSATDSADEVESAVAEEISAEPTTTAVPTTTVAATPTTTMPAGEGDADCLNGEWRSDAPAIQTMIDTLGMSASIGMTIDEGSFLSASLHDGAFVNDSEISFHAELPGGDASILLSAGGTYHMEGTYTVEGNLVRATTVTESGDLTDWTMTMDGVEMPLPGGADLGEPPAVGTSGFDGSTFTCDDTTLVFTVGDPAIPDIVYTRVG